MKKVIVFINGELGIEILSFLIPRKDTEISAVVINGLNKVTKEYENSVHKIIFETGRDIDIFQYSTKLWDNSNFNKHLTGNVYGISVLFGHIFPDSIIKKFDGNLINLHPSLLPIGRGADPIFWSIVEQLPQGASIHRVEKVLDAGEIFAQEEIKIQSWLNSGQIYVLAMEKLLQLFVDFYPRWDDSTPSFPQVGKGTYHEVRELTELKANILNSPGILFEQLNLIQALTYNDDRRARIALPNKKVWEVSLHLKQIEG